MLPYCHRRWSMFWKLIPPATSSNGTASDISFRSSSLSFTFKEPILLSRFLILVVPIKVQRKWMNHKRFDTLENKILQNISKVIWNQTQLYMSILVNTDSWFYYSTKPKYHSFEDLATRQIYSQWCHKTQSQTLTHKKILFSYESKLTHCLWICWH